MKVRENNIVIVTTVFPSCIAFMSDFFQSLSNQTLTEFDIFVLNDGVESFSDLIEPYSNLNILEYSSNLSPIKNREIAINKVIELGYKLIVFGDIDDYFACNRIEVSIEKLQDYDIVVNDLTLFDAKGILEENYISSRISNNTSLFLKDILDKNMFGLSNTAIRTSIISNVDYDETLIALDWFIYSDLLNDQKTAIFTSETKTYYRQHKNNTAGLGVNSLESVKRSISVKIEHYRLMAKKNARYESLLEEMNAIRNRIELIENSIKIEDNCMKLLWWENTKLIK